MIVIHYIGPLLKGEVFICFTGIHYLYITKIPFDQCTQLKAHSKVNVLFARNIAYRTRIVSPMSGIDNQCKFRRLSSNEWYVCKLQKHQQQR